MPSSTPRLDRPLIIIGSPRSGTTFLGHLLATHRDLIYVEEPRLVWKYGNDRSSDALNACHATDSVVRHIRQSFAESVAAGQGSRLLEKTPSNALRIDFVDRVLPEALFIHVIRNGVDAALSIADYWKNHAQKLTPEARRQIMHRIKELDLRRFTHYAGEAFRRLAPSPIARRLGGHVWGPRLPGIGAMTRDLDTLQIAALQWRACVETACQQGRALGRDRYFEVRLEDLTPEMFKRILNFAQLNSDPNVWQAFEAKYDRDAGFGRRSAGDPDQVRQIERWIEPTAYWLEETHRPRED